MSLVALGSWELLLILLLALPLLAAVAIGVILLVGLSSRAKAGPVAEDEPPT